MWRASDNRHDTVYILLEIQYIRIYIVDARRIKRKIDKMNFDFMLRFARHDNTLTAPNTRAASYFGNKYGRMLNDLRVCARVIAMEIE